MPSERAFPRAAFRCSGFLKTTNVANTLQGWVQRHCPLVAVAGRLRGFTVKGSGFRFES